MLTRAIAAAILLVLPGVRLGADSGVKLWEEDIVLPTYLAGDPEPPVHVTTELALVRFHPLPGLPRDDRLL